MPDLHINDSEPERRDAERLSLAWNALVHSRADASAALDPADAAVIERLGALAAAPPPRPAFVNHLKEHLMDTSFSMAVDGAAHRQPPVPPARLVGEAPARRTRRWRDASRRGLGAVATIALLVVSLIGGYLAISLSDLGGGRQGDLAGLPTGATPAASPEPCVDDCPNHEAPPYPVIVVGHGFINKPDLSEADLAAAKVQLQDWTVAPGATIDVPADSTDRVHGAVADFVLDGTYVVTIDGPAVVSRNNLPIRRSVEYQPAGAPIELGRGDVISYPAGRARTIVNPLTSTTLHFKSAVIYDGDVALTRPAEPLPAGLHIQVQGDGSLPMRLQNYPLNEVDVDLTYMQVAPGAKLPEKRGVKDRIIGPVDPQQPRSDGAEGYVLWVGRVLA